MKIPLTLKSLLTWIATPLEFTVSVPAHQHMNERPIRTISVGEERRFLSRNNPVKAADSASGGSFSPVGMFAQLGFGLNLVEATGSTFPVRGFDPRLKVWRAGSDAKQVTNRSRRLGGVCGEQEGVTIGELPATPKPPAATCFPNSGGDPGNSDLKHHGGKPRRLCALGRAFVPPSCTHRCNTIDLNDTHIWLSGKSAFVHLLQGYSPPAEQTVA